MRLSTFTIPFAFLGVVACTGSVPPGNNPDAPAGGPDAAPGAEMVNVSGTTMDYFSDTAIPLSQTTVSVEGITPPVNNTSDGTGRYTVDVPPGSVAYAIATRASYLPTRNVPVTTTTPDVPVMQDLYVGSASQTTNLYLNIQGVPVVLQQPGMAVVMSDLARNDGTPLIGIPLADVSLVDNAVPPAPVPGIIGPYFINVDGNLDANLAVSTTFNGRTRLGILACPVGNWNLLVNYTTGQGQPATFTVPIMCDANGLTLGRTGGLGGGGGGGGGGGPQNPTFTGDIWKRLNSPALNPEGRACTSCHNQARLDVAGGGLCTGLNCVPIAYDGPAADVYAKIMALSQTAPKIVDLITPADSMILTKPMYELTPPQNHPNATFLNAQDPDYIIIMRWITQGAVMGP